MGKEGKFDRSNCATSLALEIVGDRWSLLIIRDFIFVGSREYADFLEMREGISTNTLASRLNWLADSDIFTKHEHPTNKKKYYYEITEKGLDLILIIMDLAQWSWKYVPGAFSPPNVRRGFSKDRTAFVKEWRKRVRQKSKEYLVKASQL